MKRTFFKIIVMMLVCINFAQAQPPLTPQQAEIMKSLTPEQVGKVKSLTPEQKSSIQTEVNKTGGNLTPAAIDALKTRPEFKGVSPDDVLKAKELLDKKEKTAEKVEKKGAEKIEIERKPLEDLSTKKVIEEKTGDDRALFERFRAIGSYQDISTTIRPFGFDFFLDGAIKVITDRKDIPVPTKYIIGPGDEVKILFWGRVNAQHNLVVDRNGNITVPQIGPIPVAGMTFEDMSKLLIKQSEQIVGANIDITMGALKTIPIFVLGDVRRPGAYTIGSFATITDALLISGGPSGIGSMRNIQLRRGNKIITTFDLYDLLLNGDKSKDVILQSGDVIFVPVAGPLVGVAGNVKRPAIYELRDKYDLQTIFNLAGGIIPTAYTQQIQIERIIKNERQVIVDIDDKDLTKSKNFFLQDADFVKVFNIVEKEGNVFFLTGNVKRPGKYEYKPGMRLGDILKDPSDLLAETYLDYALIRRLSPPDMKTEFIPFNLGRFLYDKDQMANIELKSQDNIYVFSKWFFKDRPMVTIRGEVRTGGLFGLSSNMKIKDLILLAGGLTKNAYLLKAEITRMNKVNNKKIYTTRYFNVEKALFGDQEENLLLEEEDLVIIHAISEFSSLKNVFIEGDVTNPGAFQYTEQMRVSDLVFKAGNVLESAYLGESELSSQTVENGSIVRLDHRRINLQEALKGNPVHNVLLKPLDRMFVKRIPNWQSERFVTISGEVLYPGKYVIKKGEPLSSLIERAGGYTDKAFLRGAVFRRDSVRELQQKGMEEVIKRMERELLAAGTSVSTAISAEEIAGKKVELEQKTKFIANLRELKALGRMSIGLTSLRLLKKSPYDIQLEDGDSLDIPPRPGVVNVTGAVMSQGSFIYSDKLNYRDYIDLAGGFASYANQNNTYILKVDGSAKRVASGFLNWSDNRSRWELAGFAEEIKEIEPGDMIVVPEKLERIAWLREIKDITQILMQMAVTAGVVIKLF